MSRATKGLILFFFIFLLICSKLQKLLAEREALGEQLPRESEMNEYHHLRSCVTVLTDKMSQVRNNADHCSVGTEFGFFN
jgi:hypothetical protein